MDREYDYEDMINYGFDEPMHQILVALAKRKNPDVIDDWNRINYDPIHYKIRCLICGKTFPNMPGINRHGIKHLQDSNLLPFM